MKYLIVISGVLLGLALAGLPAQAQNPAPYGYYGQPQGWHAVLSAHDQQQFDKFYSKWVDATRKNDQDDIAGNARRMQEIMARYNIPANTPFDQVASGAVAGAYASPPNGAYPGAYPAYGAAARLSPEDQQKFDSDYNKWLEAQRKNDQDDVAHNASKMQEIMARYSIPPNVPFAAIASNGNAAGPNGSAPYPYAYGQPAQRLSPKDQGDFDQHYRKWVDASRKRDMDDVQKHERAMRDIMARYNIPANVPFDQIASGGVYR